MYFNHVDGKRSVTRPAEGLVDQLFITSDAKLDSFSRIGYSGDGVKCR